MAQASATPSHHGGLGFSHKWNMGWMHDTLGYFAPRPGAPPLAPPRPHLRPALRLQRALRAAPVSHDEVVHGKGSLLNKMPGDEWQRFANLRALYGWMWAYPGDPLLFMGGEIAQWGEWSETKGVDWAALEGERHRGVQELVRALNRVAGEWPALWSATTSPAGFQWLDADDADHSMYGFLRWSADGREVVACIANFTPVPREGYRVGLPWARRVAGAARHQRHLLRRHGPGRVPGRRGRATTSRTRASRPRRSSPSRRSRCSGSAPAPRDGRPERSGRRHRLAGARRRRRPGRRLVRRAGGGQRADRPAGHGHVAPRVHGRVAVRRRRGPGRRRQRSGGRGQRPAPGRPQRRLRPGAGPDPARDRWAAGCWRRSSSSTSRRPWPPRSPTGRARSGPSGPRGWPSSCAGTPAPCSAPWPAARSATRPSWGWTRRSRPASSC